MARVDSSAGQTGSGGFLGVRLESTPESSSCARKPLILSHKIQRGGQSGFQVDSPVKTPHASKLMRPAPPYTHAAQEEPWVGGGRPRNAARKGLRPYRSQAFADGLSAPIERRGFSRPFDGVGGKRTFAAVLANGGRAKNGGN